MKRILYMMTALLVLASCAKDNGLTEAVEQPLDISVVFGTKAGGSGDDEEITEPIVNSMRVLVFDNTGALSFNTFYAFGFNTSRDEENNKYIVSLANPVVLPQSACTQYDIYVVLNEEGFTLSSGTETNLHEALGDFNDDENALQGILETPVVYAAVLKNVDEPAFLISGMKSVDFTQAGVVLGEVTPITINADSSSSTDDYNRGRSMAQIVVEKITSEPADGVDDYSSNLVPLIFVKSVELVNIPKTIAWSKEDGTITNPATEAMNVAVGAANAHTGTSDGTFYDRIWYGHITRTITGLWAKQTQYTDAKLYRAADNSTDANKKKWSFHVPPYNDDTHAPFTFSVAQGPDVTPKNDANNALKSLDAWDKANLAAQIPAVFAEMQKDEDGKDTDMSQNITFTEYQITTVQNETKEGMTKTAIGSMVASDDYWTVRLGEKFYVPENIQSAKTNATCIKIKLAVAAPKFSFRLNDVNKKEKNADKRIITEDLDPYSEDQLKNVTVIDLSNLNPPTSLPGTLTYTYQIADSLAGKYVTVEKIDAKLAKKIGKIVWADNESHVVEYPTDGKDLKNWQEIHNEGFHVFIDGFSRYSNEVQTTEETGVIKVNENLPGATFNWGVDRATHTCEYIIPINNQIDGGDYSVRRNTRYTVTLYVNAGTYTSLSTKSGPEAPFTVTAKVTTEKVSCDEE